MTIAELAKEVEALKARIEALENAPASNVIASGSPTEVLERLAELERRSGVVYQPTFAAAPDAG